MFIARLSRYLFRIIKHIELNCKIIPNKLSVLSIFLPHDVNLRVRAFWILVDLINVIGALFKVVIHHLLTQQLESRIVVVEYEQSWLFVVKGQRFLLTVFLFFLESVAKLTVS